MYSTNSYGNSMQKCVNIQTIKHSHNTYIQQYKIATFYIIKNKNKYVKAKLKKLRILRWRYCPGLSGQAQYNNKGSYKRKMETEALEKYM